MKTADIDIEDMAVAGNVVLKRTARVAVEYGAESDAAEHSSIKKPASKKKADDTTSQKADIKASTSGVGGVMAPSTTAMNGGTTKPYSRRGSTTERAASTDRADKNGSQQRGGGYANGGGVDGSNSKHADRGVHDSPTLAKPSLMNSHKLDALHQPDGQPINFGEVLPGIYRSSFPKAEDYPFYQQLGLKTVVTLVQKDFPTEYKPFLAENGISHHVFDMEGTKKQTIPLHTMTAILRLVLDPRNYPLLLHCNHGRHRTGCVVAAIRKYYRWDMDSVLDEYRTFAEPKIRDCDIEYISSFNHLQLANMWEKDDHHHQQGDVDGTVVHRPLIRHHHHHRDERTTGIQPRIRRFQRTAFFVFVMLLIWAWSGNRMIMANNRCAARAPHQTGLRGPVGGGVA